MAENESRSESPLSDIGSDAFTEEKFQRSRSHSHASAMSDISEGSVTPSASTPRNVEARPAKRRRLDYDQPTPRSSNVAAPPSPAGSISSDSSGSVPTSPTFANLPPTHPLSTLYNATQLNPNDPESADYTQVTRCQWTNCERPEQGNMDNLVKHINEVHIPPRQKKYFCEWEGCPRKSVSHNSAYALKAHMRSHTKEKPSMCQVPECDRSFTRSDALAKHMRTVHETEALRPSDPVPRGHTGGISQANSTTNGHGTKAPKLKLTFKNNKVSGSAEAATEPKVEGGLPTLPTTSSVVVTGLHGPRLAELDAEELKDEALTGAIDMDSVPFTLPIHPEYYPEEIYADLDEYERTLPPSQYFRLLRRQLRWATEEGRSLDKELKELKAKTDDLRGNPVTKQGVKEEEVGDLVRREEWTVVEDLLDRIMYSQIEVEKANLQLPPDDPADGDIARDAALKVIQSLEQTPFWKASKAVSSPTDVPVHRAV